MKTKNLSKPLRSRALALVGVSIAAAVLMSSSFLPSVGRVAYADTYDEQIKQLERQNAATQGSLNGLLGEAANYQDAIGKLQSQINALQAVIATNQAEQASVGQQIVDAQNQINQQRATLASNVKAMYVDGTPSTLEMLANSKDLNDFVDQQEYRTSVQNKLQDTLRKIAALQVQLQDKKQQLDTLLQDLQQQRTQLNTSRAEQASLLAYNTAQQNDYSAQMSANNARMATLRVQQAAALAALTGAGGRSPVGSSITYRNMTGPQNCGGGYDYCASGLDDWVPDDWGLHLARECVHYVANALDDRGYRIPYNLFSPGRGSAYQWIGTTTSTGTASLVGDPQAGDVVYMPIGSVGHVAIVDYVNGDGSLHVSQMNWYPGKYNTMDLVKTSNLRYLRFNK